MENRKLVIFATISLLLSFPLFVSAYKPENTHRGLTHDIINFYERFYPGTFTNEDKVSIEKGSVDEDSGTRALNHFYDPVYNEAIVPTSLTSKEWAANTTAQANSNIGYLASLGNVTRAYFDSADDYSWDRAVYEYAHGDKKRGLEGLGHILHLVEDATVPDHTRGDPHPDFFRNDALEQESPYEKFANRFNLGNLRVSDELVKTGQKPVLRDSLGEYFDYLAGYSNSNFFSKDTVFSKKYIGPTVSYEKSQKLSDGTDHIFGYNGIGSRLVEIKKERNKSNGVIKKSYIFDDDDHVVLADYWNLLSKQAVQNGAGVIKLFFDDVEKEKKTLALQQKNKSLFKKGIAGVLSAFGSTGNSSNKVASADATEETNNVQAPVNEDAVESSTVEISPPPEVELVSEPVQQEAESDSPVDEPLVVAPKVVVPPSPVDNAPQPKFVFNISPGFGGGAPPPVSSNPPQVAEQTQPPGAQASDDADATATATSTDPVICDDSLATNFGDPLPCLYPQPAPPVPTIISPADFSSPFSTTTISFMGTSSPSFVISNSMTSATTTADDSGDWNLVFSNLPEGDTMISFYASDPALSGESATSSPREISFNITFPRPDPPTIPSHSFPLQIMNSTSVTFTGSTTPNFSVFNDYTNATTTADALGSWSISLTNLSEGTTTISFYATDVTTDEWPAGLRSEPETVSFNVYNYMPAASGLSVGECAHKLLPDPNGCYLPAGQATASWSVNSPNYKYFEIMRGTFNAGQTTYTVFATTTATSTTIQTEESDYSYILRVRSVDIFGTVQDANSSLTFFLSHSPPVSITEVAWAGTDASSVDQWVELKNNTLYETDLSHISLRSSGGMNVPLSGTISGLGYLIIDLSPDGFALSDISAASTSVPYVLSPDGEILSLVFDGGVSSTTIDQTPAVADCGGWCGGSVDGHKTMERRQTETAGSDKNNWLSNNTVVVNGTDRLGTAVNGTPGAQNSVSMGNVGFYCSPYTSSFVEGGTYLPDVSQYGYLSCTFLSPGLSGPRVGGLYKGAVGSAIYLDGWYGNGDQGASHPQSLHTDPTYFTEGENYFAVVREIHDAPSAEEKASFDNYFTGANGITSPPHQNYEVINWKYGAGI